MDYKKDIKDTAIMSHNTKGGMETFGISVSKKCERLATAVYLVTNFLSDSEPLKFRLRTLSIDFVREASFVRSGSQETESNVLDGLKANIEESLSLLELAFIAGLVSEMNFTILKREYVSLRNTIEVKKASRESRTDTVLGDNFFNVPEPVSHPHQKGPTFESADSWLGHKRGPSPRSYLNVSEPTSNRNSKGHSIGQMNIAMSDRNMKDSVAQSLQKTSQGQVTKSVVEREQRASSAVRATTDIEKESRRTRILKLVKDSREVTIKDIATHFADLSEKTIQRELVALVEGGVLKKMGERRWSRYALA